MNYSERQGIRHLPNLIKQDKPAMEIKMERNGRYHLDNQDC
ncbi:MAG: hypothetical protein V4614_04500 [Pseudomonadota bacterium]